MIRVSVGLLVLATLAAFTGSTAQEAALPVLLEGVEVKGLGRVSESLVRSQIEVKPGDALDPAAVARDIGRFMKLDYFANVRADLDTSGGKNILVYTFKEEETIRDIRIVGNKKIKERQIRGAIQWHEGRSFYREAYGEERDALLALYRSKGFLNTTVDITVEPVAPGEVRVTYAINEGKKARISKITYAGNQALSRRKLNKVMKTRSSFLFFGGRYDQDKFENDLAQILNAYGDVGRLEAQIASTDFDYSKSGKKLYINIALAEGPEYHLESLDIAENVVYRDDELQPLVKVKPGDVHNKSQVAADATALEKLYRDSGYVRAQVLPQFTLNRETHTTAVSHQIQEDALKYLREVRITGNAITRDEVIRRNVLLKPGERFDGSLYEASQRRLESTQYFDGVPRLRVGEVEDNDRFANLLVDVEEGKTGDFNFGAAFNTDEGIGGFAELSLRNFDITDWPTFSGGGQVLSASTFIGTNRTSYRLGLTDPEFFGYPFSLGVDVFKESYEGTGDSRFTTDSIGSSVRLAKRLSLYNTASMALSFIDASITNLDTFVDPDLRELEDPGSTLSVTFGLNRNTTNSFRNPTAGGDHSISLELAGLLDNDFAGLHHDSTWYYGVKRWDRVAFSLRIRESILQPFGQKNYVPINERLFAGGSGTIRGYEFRDVGPRADTFRVVDGVVDVDDEAVGGELRLVQTFETKYRITDILRLYYFIDSGAVFFKPEDFDFDAWRFSTGLGVGIDVPFLGPIRVDYGFPLNPDDSQGKGQLHLQSSVRF